MSTVKIKKFDGIYTNVDENDLRLELFKDSLNFRHEQGYVNLELPKLGEYTLPDVNTYMNSTGWEWEAGIYTTITNDFLNQNPSPAKYPVLFLIAKKIEGPITHRLFWFKELPNGVWYELSKEGTYSDIDLVNWTGDQNFTDSIVSTDKQGEVFFREDQGTLKIYLPHDSFWFGKIERTLYKTLYPVGTDRTLNQFYLDRLVEPFNKDNLHTDYIVEYDNNIPIKRPWYPICLSTRRLGYSCAITPDYEQESIVKEIQVDWVYIGEDNSGTILPFKYYKYKVIDKETGKAYPRVTETFRLSLFNILLAPEIELHLPFDPTVHIIPKSTTTDSMVIPQYYFDEYCFVGGDALTTVFPTQTHFPEIKSTGAVGLKLIVPGDNWVVVKADWDTYNTTPGYQRMYGQNIGEVGFDSGEQQNYKIVITQVLDEREEIITGLYEGTLLDNMSTPKYALKFALGYPCRDINKRMTRTRIYIKFLDEDDYEMVKDIQYLDSKLKDPSMFYLSTLDLTGITLSQNIGYWFDNLHPEKYKIITGFKGIAVENNIGIGIDTNDYINIYYSAVGGGNIQTNLMYTTNILPLTNITFLNALVGLNGNILALTDKTTYIIKPEQQVGVLAFQIIDTLEYGIKDFHDVANTGRQVFLNTISGIILTDGYQMQVISEPINDICKVNYLTSRIDYNPVKHELYYTSNFNTSEDFYRFRMDVKKWERISVSE